MKISLYAASIWTSVAITVLLVAAMSRDAAAQVSVDVGALAYVDYYYTISTPVEEEEGLHGFTYRRLYLTTDFKLSDDFKGRARLEANDGTTGSKGPVPFVKDLYLTWNYAGDHSITMGVAPPPVFEITEKVFGYRSLEKNILDFQGIVDSRDFGVRINGPLLPNGSVRYAAMFANNNAARPESDIYKRGYAQLEIYPLDHLTFTVGADYSGFSDENPLESATRVSGLAAYSSDRFTLGVEPYLFIQIFDVGEDFQAVGASAFARVSFSSEWELIARADRVSEERASQQAETFFVGGIAFKPNKNVKIIPNVWIFKVDHVDKAEALGRLTLDVSF